MSDEKKTEELHVWDFDGTLVNTPVPFAAFDRPERMGRAVMRGALRTEAVCEVGFMVLKGEGNVGAFALDVREVGCFK